MTHLLTLCDGAQISGRFLSLDNFYAQNVIDFKSGISLLSTAAPSGVSIFEKQEIP
jgi:hypothetical protein